MVMVPYVHAFILFMALYVSVIVGGEVSIRGSDVDPLASESKHLGEVLKGFNKVLKYTLATLPQITASHLRTLTELIRSHTSASIIVGSWQMHP